MLVGGVLLFISLFLTWSHQLTPEIRRAAAGSAILSGVPADPTAWQVYSIVDVLLALLAVAVVVLALAGPARARPIVLGLVLVALAFTAHALSAPPTNGVLLVNPAAPGRYVPRDATAGAGEAVAIVALALASAGLGLSLARR